MIIFSDKHHSGLSYSLHLTLEKRLGHTLYFPIGEEWADQGYWQIHKPYNYSRDTVKQYLGLDTRYVPKDGTPPLNIVSVINSTHYEIPDLAHNCIEKHITLEQFKEMKIDVIIASIPDHAVTFKKLRDTYHPKAKLVFQMGNMFHEIVGLIKDSYVRNLLASTVSFPLPGGVNALFYHQEINTDVFKYTEPIETNAISSFVIGLPREDLFLAYRNLLPQFDFKAYASKYGPFLSPTTRIAETMAQSRFGWNVKPRGDGFSHILYDWFHIGRPVITDMRDYRDKLANEILNDTAIDIGGLTPEEGVRKIVEFSKPDNYRFLVNRIHEKVQRLVNYSTEALNIQQFLNRLQ